MPKKTKRCEGFRRYGGAFTLGPVRWEQCKNQSTVMLKVRQDNKTTEFPACPTCLQEAMTTKAIKVISARTI